MSQCVSRTVGCVAAAVLALFLWTPVAQAALSDFGIASANASLSTAEAGAHPDFVTSFEVKTDPESAPNAFGLHDAYGSTREVRVELPGGLLGNLNAVPTCSAAQLALWSFAGGGCPNASQVGTTVVYAYLLSQVFTEPVYLMESPGDGRAAARLGFIAGSIPAFIDVGVRSGSDYGVTARVVEAPAPIRLVKAETQLWGVPADSAHDTERQTAFEAFEQGAAASPPRPPGIPPTPFLTNPTACGDPLSVGFAVAAYGSSERPEEATAPLPAITGCNKVPFQPAFSVEPTTHGAASPTGLEANFALPQDESPQGRASSALRDAEVQLPRGFTLNAAAADGLVSCSAEQAGYHTDGPSACPQAARIGTAQFDVPSLQRPVNGFIYQRTPEAGNLFRIWLISDELGVHVKIPGDVRADPSDGRITSVFLDSPQVPLRNLKLRFKEGSRAPLATPDRCGAYQTNYEFTPWSGGRPVKGLTSLSIDEGCDKGGFAPALSAGSTLPLAGRFSPFVTTLSRRDGEESPSTIEVKLPAGSLAKLAGVAVCPESSAGAGTCPAGSRVGSVSVASGVGPTPLWIPQQGKSATALYLAGPYEGAPYSLVFVVPAQAGPFDLGRVVTRAGIHIDPDTAEVTVRSDALPQLLEGVPVDYRAIRVSIDRPEFTLNPTSCAQKRVRAVITSTAGSVAQPSAPFAVAACGALDFNPRFSLALKGGTRRAQHPALKSVLTFPAGHQANIAAASVLLPPTEQIDNAHVQQPCTRVQFAAEACPAKSVLGTATAYTPLLDRPLTGKVYFRSNGGARKLPDIVADLRGDIHVVLVGFVDSIKGKGGSVRIRTRFESVPDAPVSKFVIDLKGGKKGLLVNSGSLCARPRRVRTSFVAQNGDVLHVAPRLATSCRRLGRR